jgi:DNA-binding SARP family transcriptional activator
MPSDALVRLRLLGRCEIIGPAGAVQLETAKTTALLGYLALHDGPQPRPRLAGLLWPEISDTRAAGNLRRAVWDLRRRLEAGDRPPVIEASRGAVGLVRECCELDVADFRRAVATARAAADAEPEAVLAALGRAVALYRGGLDPDPAA